MNPADIARLVESLAHPLLLAVRNPKEEALLIRRLGYAPPPEGVTVFSALRSTADLITDTIAALSQYLESGDTSGLAKASLDIVTAAESLPGAISNLQGTLSAEAQASAVVSQTDFLQTLTQKLVDLLVVDFLTREFPVVAGVLRLAGLIDLKPVRQTTDPNLVPHVATAVAWESLPKFATNPLNFLTSYYNWGAAAGLEAGLLFENLRILATAMGLRSDYRSVDPASRQAFNKALGVAGRITENPNSPSLRLPVLPLADVTAGFDLFPVENPAGVNSGLAIDAFVEAAATLVFQLTDRIRIDLHLGGYLTGFGLLFEPNQPITAVSALSSGNPGDLLGDVAIDVDATIAYQGLAGHPIVFLGSETATRLQADSLQGKVGVKKELQQTDVEFRIEASISKAAIIVKGGDGDGFLAKILPPDGFTIDFDFLIGFSTRTGIYFGIAGGIEIAIPVNFTLFDVITIETVYLSVRADATGGKTAITATGSVTVDLKIGPFAATVDRIGIQALLHSAETTGNLGPMDLGIRFKPPDGAGFVISAGPVTGGGYLFFDADDEQYAGILQLSFKTIGLTAIGLLTTRLPDDSGAPGATKKGFSLLIIITVDLPPIQLGYGFTLNGVGGLLGVNRTMVVDALRNGVRDGSVNSILFPQDPIAHASQIISQLRAIFPPSEGRYVFGPMVKIGWGPNALLELQAAVVLELTAPIRLVILGRIQVALPDKKDPVLNLRLDSVGVLDFDRGEASIDASLVDSKLLTFALTGDMALRVGWGATKLFAMSAGGFHPHFQPPPSFPQLGRLAIALADSDNPRVRLESYLALTSNSVQFGALADIFAKADTFVGTFSLSAKAGFDALIQFSPFELTTDLSAAVDIDRDGAPLLHAALHASLTGPAPWLAVGYAEFDCMGTHRIDFTLTVGTASAPPPAVIAPLDVLAAVAAAFASPDAWAALPPDDGDRVASFLNGSSGGAVLAHPLGSLSARQRLLPLGQNIDRFGTSIVATPVSLSLVGFQLPASAVAAQADDLFDDFAPGQFRSLTDDERIGRPAFESMRSGGTVSATSFRLPADRPGGLTQASGYEESIVDVDPSTGARSATVRAGVPVELADDTVAKLARAGASAHAATRTSGAARFKGADLGIRVMPVRYVLASVDTLARATGAPNESAAEAHDRLDQTSRSGGNQVVLAREVA